MTFAAQNGTGAVAVSAARRLRKDPNTLSNYLAIESKHVEIDWHIRFPGPADRDGDRAQPGVVSGRVTHLLASLVDGVDRLVLDTSALAITEVLAQNGTALGFVCREQVEPFGSALEIELPARLAANEEIKIQIAYETTLGCTALQWLDPSQTAGRTDPYMFAQCQPIHARSLLPCQDTPSVKMTFEARVHSPLPTIMSGVPDARSEPDGAGAWYSFRQAIPIPSYLITIASGNIASLPIGSRSRVYCEPEVLEKAKWEFEADMDLFLATAEDIAGPYVWKEYNLLVLPPSFPYGGMENPNFTFVTPTLLSGDRANVDVVAHEVAHSWSGNLVTNATWIDFWLNEGWTVFLERKILERLRGTLVAEFSAIIGWNALRSNVDFFASKNELEYTKLNPDVSKINPDEAFGTVPYEKGYNLLRLIQTTVGGAEKFDPFIKAYFAKFSGQACDTPAFMLFLFEWFECNQGVEIANKLKALDWETWLQGTGMPPIDPGFDATLATPCYSLAERWNTFRENPAAGDFLIEDVNHWTQNQKVVFLERLETMEPLSHSALEIMSDLYRFSESSNAEIVSHWFTCCMLSRWLKILPLVAKWLPTMGRMKFVRPAYRLLYECDNEMAVALFEKNQNALHPICRNLVRRDLHLD